MPDNEPEVMDLRGLKCPLPALLARRALADKPSGYQVTVVADDPMAFIDVPHMCRDEGHEVITVERDGDISRILLRRGA
jgi:tRNA 2-thiouridine synthesizing protein A